MASELKAASGYTSVSRAGSITSGWTAGGTLGTDDGNRTLCIPYNENPPLPAPTTSYVGVNAQILRVSFGAFTLPTSEIIVSATVAVKHRQDTASPDGGTLVFENTGAVITSNTDITTTFSVSGLTISSLNAGTATVDLLYNGTGTISAPLASGLPTPAVNYVTLTVVTAPALVGSDPLSFSSLTRIPALGVN